MNNASPLGEMLREALAEKLAAKRAQQDARDQMIRAGYSNDETKQFLLLRESLNDMSGTLAMASVLVQQRRHKPSAQLAVMLATYLIDTAAWQYEVMRRANVDPEVFGMRPSPESFCALMARTRQIAQDLLDEPTTETATG